MRVACLPPFFLSWKETENKPLSTWSTLRKLLHLLQQLHLFLSLWLTKDLLTKITFNSRRRSGETAWRRFLLPWRSKDAAMFCWYSFDWMSSFPQGGRFNLLSETYGKQKSTTSIETKGRKKQGRAGGAVWQKTVHISTGRIPVGEKLNSKGFEKKMDSSQIFAQSL